jgi:hypothetical protein
MKLWLPLFYVLSLVSTVFCDISSSSSSSSASNSLSCVDPNPSHISFCNNFVNYQIPSNLDQLAVDARARGFGNQGAVCPYYAYKPYICAKYFPACVNNVAIRLCRIDCYKANNGGACANFNQMYFDDECTDNTYYTDSADCRTAPTQSSGDNSIYWKIGLGLGLFVLAIAVLFFWWRARRVSNMSQEELDRDEAKQLRKNAEKERKRRLKQGIEGVSADDQAAIDAALNSNNIIQGERGRANTLPNPAELARARLAAQREGRPQPQRNSLENQRIEVEMQPRAVLGEEYRAEHQGQEGTAEPGVSSSQGPQQLEGYTGTPVAPPE